MFRRLVHTPDDHTLTWMRAALGVIFFAHGAQKLLGWFGGPGYSATIGMFTHALGIPEVFAVIAILTEFIGGILLFLGLFTRIPAIGIAIDMLVALFLVHLPNGFFMNWSGTKHGEGFEFHILAICMAAAIAVRGAGAWSFDRLLEGSAGRSIPIHYHPAPSRV